MSAIPRLTLIAGPSKSGKNSVIDYLLRHYSAGYLYNILFGVTTDAQLSCDKQKLLVGKTNAFIQNPEKYCDEWYQRMKKDGGKRYIVLIDNAMTTSDHFDYHKGPLAALHKLSQSCGANVVLMIIITTSDIPPSIQVDSLYCHQSVGNKHIASIFPGINSKEAENYLLNLSDKEWVQVEQCGTLTGLVSVKSEDGSRYTLEAPISYRANVIGSK